MKIPKFVPNRKARQFFISENLLKSRLPAQVCKALAKMVPDVIFMHAVFYKNAGLFLELTGESVFLRMGEDVIYLGEILSNQGDYILATGQWHNIEFSGMTDAEILDVNVPGMISGYDKSKWETEFDRYDNFPPNIRIDISKRFFDFLEL